MISSSSAIQSMSLGLLFQRRVIKETVTDSSSQLTPLEIYARVKSDFPSTEARSYLLREIYRYRTAQKDVIVCERGHVNPKLTNNGKERTICGKCMIQIKPFKVCRCRRKVRPGADFCPGCGHNFYINQSVNPDAMRVFLRRITESEWVLLEELIASDEGYGEGLLIDRESERRFAFQISRTASPRLPIERLCGFFADCYRDGMARPGRYPQLKDLFERIEELLPISLPGDQKRFENYELSANPSTAFIGVRIS